MQFWVLQIVIIASVAIFMIDFQNESVKACSFSLQCVRVHFFFATNEIREVKNGIINTAYPSDTGASIRCEFQKILPFPSNLCLRMNEHGRHTNYFVCSLNLLDSLDSFFFLTSKVTSINFPAYSRSTV